MLGMIAGNGVAVLLFGLGYVLFYFSPGSAVAAGLPSLLFIPFCIGLTAAWTPDFNLAVLNGVIYRGGAACPIGLYAMHDRKIFGQRVSFRAGANRVYDLVQGESKYYKTAANSLNATTGTLKQNDHSAAMGRMLHQDYDATLVFDDPLAGRFWRLQRKPPR